MPSLEPLISDVASKYALGAKAPALVAEVIGLISGGTGGLAGFLDRLKRAGLGDVIASWFGTTTPAPMSLRQVEQSFGVGGIEAIAGKFGLEAGAVAPALGYIVPKLIGALTPGGTLPTSIPVAWSAFADEAGVAGLAKASPAATPLANAGRWATAGGLLAACVAFLAWLGNFFGPAPEPIAPVAETKPAVTTVAEAPPLAAPAPAPSVAPAIVPSEPPLIPPAPIVTEAAPPGSASTTPTQAAGSIASRLDLTFNAANFVQYSGVVPDEQTRTAVLDALKAAFGAGNLRGELAIDPSAAPAPWLARLKAAFDGFKSPGLAAKFDGATIKIGGLIDESVRDRVIARLKTLLGSAFTLAASDDVNARASAALRSLGSDVGAKEVTEALNLMIIRFPTGSAEVQSFNRPILAEAAAYLKRLPEGKSVEVQGHTDNVGDDRSNLVLSQRRADAVRAMLLAAGVPATALTATGYGASKPKASNDTVEGRFENRRIEFVVVR